MEESILTSTKKMLNVGADDTSFDHDITTHINSAFSHLHQLGVGPSNGFDIEDATPTWSDFADLSKPMMNEVKKNVYLNVRALFDMPTMPHVSAALTEQIERSDWSLALMAEQAV